MFNDFDLKNYAERQSKAVGQKYDLAMRNALEEEKLRGKNAKERQDSANKTALEQEKMQQEGQTGRQNAVIAADADVKKSQSGLMDAQAKGVSADTTGKNLSNDFQKAVQPKLIEEQNSRAVTNMAQNSSFRTHYSNLQATDERNAILGGYNVSKEGVVSNKPEYLDPIFGRGNLQSDLKALQEPDSTLRNNSKIKPKLLRSEPLSRMSTGQLPTKKV